MNIKIVTQLGYFYNSSAFYQLIIQEWSHSDEMIDSDCQLSKKIWDAISYMSIRQLIYLDACIDERFIWITPSESVFIHYTYKCITPYYCILKRVLPIGVNTEYGCPLCCNLDLPLSLHPLLFYISYCLQIVLEMATLY